MISKVVGLKVSFPGLCSASCFVVASRRAKGARKVR